MKYTDYCPNCDEKLPERVWDGEEWECELCGEYGTFTARPSTSFESLAVLSSEHASSNAQARQGYRFQVYREEDLVDDIPKEDAIAGYGKSVSEAIINLLRGGRNYKNDLSNYNLATWEHNKHD